MRYYRVEFETKKDGYKRWVIDVTTTSIEKAKYVAKHMWEDGNGNGHQFHIRARRLKDNEEYLYNYFYRLDNKPEVAKREEIVF